MERRRQNNSDRRLGDATRNIPACSACLRSFLVSTTQDFPAQAANRAGNDYTSAAIDYLHGGLSARGGGFRAIHCFKLRWRSQRVPCPLRRAPTRSVGREVGMLVVLAHAHGERGHGTLLRLFEIMTGPGGGFSLTRA